MKYTKALCGAAMAFAIGTSGAYADEDAQQMLMDAMPVMHYSCASLIAEADGNEEFVHDVVSKITFVSLYNHSVDLSKFATTDEERETLRAAFVEEIRTGCAPDKNALLAGIIDRSVMTALGL